MRLPFPMLKWEQHTTLLSISYLLTYINLNINQKEKSVNKKNLKSFLFKFLLVIPLIFL